MEFLNPHASPPQTSVDDTSDQAFMLENLAEQFFGDFENGPVDFDPAFMSFAEESNPKTPQVAIERQGATSTSEDVHLDRHDGVNPQILGYSGDMDPYLLQNYQFDRSGAFKFKQLSIQSAYQGAAPTQFLLSQPGLFLWSRKEMGLSVSPEASRAQLESVVPADTGRRLICLYRKFILTQYPIFSESSFPNPHTSPPCLLAAIYMIAQPFAKFDDVLSIELAYDTLNSQALFTIVFEALHYEAHNPSLDLVQMLLLLIVRPSTNPLILESSLKWSLHGTLVSTAQNMGLHHDPASWAIAPWQRTLRRRLSCTIFTVDKWLACSLGRPPLLRKEDWLVTSLTIEDNQASTMNADIWSTHMHYAQLGALLGDVLEKLFSLRAVHELASDFRTTLDISKRLLEHLSEWHNGHIADSSDHAEQAVSLMTLSTLGHHYVQMTIYRAIIRPTLSAARWSTSTPLHVRQEEEQEIVRFARTGLQSATTAATAFIKSLQQEHLHMFWPQWSQVAFSCICFLQLLMASSSPHMEEAVSWFEDLHATRKLMRLKSDMLPVLRLGLLRIDALFWKRIDKVLHLNPDLQQALEASRDDGAA
ncbi:transcriptional regulatory protein C25B8.11 [Paraphaeosphaeria sporulosa]